MKVVNKTGAAKNETSAGTHSQAGTLALPVILSIVAVILSGS
jgi:hypothetical protein